MTTKHNNTNKHTPTNIQHKTSIKQTNIPKTEIDICTDWICIISQSFTDICTDRICIISQSLITAQNINKKITVSECIFWMNMYYFTIFNNYQHKKKTAWGTNFCMNCTPVPSKIQSLLHIRSWLFKKNTKWLKYWKN